MSRFSLLTIFFIAIPTIVFADVRITEISWMGTTESQFSEWIEFYNDTNEAIDLAGWKLYEAGGDTLIFTFSKSIPAKDYLLLERTTASAPDPVPGVSDESGSFGGSGLSNSGEFLVLKDASGTIKQSLDFSGGWPAGDSESKKTMQLAENGWITALATPKAATSGIETPVDTTSIVSSSGGSAWVSPKVEPRIDLIVSKSIYTDIQYEYQAKMYLDSGQVHNGLFVWNMGDGVTHKSTTPEVINHTYKYPGLYTISVAFYKTAYDKKPTLFETTQRSVDSAKVSVRIDNQRGFILSNNENIPFDVSDWIVRTPEKTIQLPSLFIIAPKTSITVPFAHLGVTGPFSDAILLTPEWKEVVSKGSVEPVLSAEKKTVSTIIKKVPLVASVENIVSQKEEPLIETTQDEKQGKQKSYTKAIFLGIALLVVIGLFLLLERFMAQQE